MWNAIELVKQIRYGLGRYTYTIVCNRDFPLTAGYGYFNALARVFDGIVNQIVQYI